MRRRRRGATARVPRERNRLVRARPARAQSESSQTPRWLSMTPSEYGNTIPTMDPIGWPLNGWKGRTAPPFRGIVVFGVFFVGDRWNADCCSLSSVLSVIHNSRERKPDSRLTAESGFNFSVVRSYPSEHSAPALGALEHFAHRRALSQRPVRATTRRSPNVHSHDGERPSLGNAALPMELRRVLHAPPPS